MLKYNLDIDDKSKWIIVPEVSIAKKLPFFMTEIGDFNCGKFHFTERDYKEGFLLIYTVSGNAKLKINNQEKLLQPNSAVVFNCNLYHRYESYLSDWHYMWIHINGFGTKVYEELLNDKTFEVVNIIYHNEFINDINSAINFALRNDIISCVQISDTISRILSNMLTLLLSSNLQTNTYNSHYNEIHSVIDFIKKNYHKQISLSDMTSMINISKYHFTRIFKAQMGHNPYEYLINYRIHQAKILLRTTPKAVYEIASEVGFLSLNNFISQFKSVVGMTPANYRRESFISNSNQIIT